MFVNRQQYLVIGLPHCHLHIRHLLDREMRQYIILDFHTFVVPPGSLTNVKQHVCCVSVLCYTEQKVNSITHHSLLTYTLLSIEYSGNE